uniref:NRDE family protein n=2 Tax=Psychrobacter phenylpyruvicus TaxID=29432 RepID=UPI00278BDDCE|nr:NRDE family protein [Psychrobacter phenylpyruvicus]
MSLLLFLECMGIKSLQAPDEQLPDTGMPPALEQALSSICIDTPEMPNYGTRTQSVLTLTKDKT